MKCLKRNQRDIWYANRVSDSYVTDKNGLKTGEKTQTYGTPVKARMNVEIASGGRETAVLALHGIVKEYDAKAVTDDLECAMDEECRVWFGIEPTHEETRTVTRTVTEEVEGEEVTHEVAEQETVEVPNPHNFVVIRRVPSLNAISYFLKEVNVS